MRSIAAGFISSLFAFTFVGFAVTARADCDPNAFLRQRLINYKNDIAVFLAWKAAYDRDFKAGHSAGAGFTYDGFPISANDAGNLEDAVHQSQSYSMNATQSTYFLYAALDPEGVDAYKACLGNEIEIKKPIRFIVHKDAMSSTEFFLHVVWQPDYYTPNNAELAINVLNGKINGQRKARFNMRVSQDLPVTITRDNNGAKELFVNAAIYGRSEDFALPPIPDFVVRLQQKDSAHVLLERNGGRGTSYVIVPYQIIPDGDDRLLPDSLTFVGSISGTTEMWTCPDAHPEINPKRCQDYHKEFNNAQRAIGEARGHATSDYSPNRIEGKFEVLQVVTTPKANGKLREGERLTDPDALDPEHRMQPSTYVEPPPLTPN